MTEPLRPSPTSGDRPAGRSRRRRSASSASTSSVCSPSSGTDRRVRRMPEKVTGPLTDRNGATPRPPRSRRWPAAAGPRPPRPASAPAPTTLPRGRSARPRWPGPPGNDLVEEGDDLDPVASGWRRRCEALVIEQIGPPQGPADRPDVAVGLEAGEEEPKPVAGPIGIHQTVTGCGAGTRPGHLAERHLQTRGPIPGRRRRCGAARPRPPGPAGLPVAPARRPEARPARPGR